MRVNDAFPFAPDTAPLTALLWKARALLDVGVKRIHTMALSTFDILRKKVFRVRSAYRRMFLDATAFPHRDGATVLTDLAKFCNAHRTTFMRAPGQLSFDPLAAAKAEGRREVWLHLMKHLGVSDAAILRLQEQEMIYE